MAKRLSKTEATIQARKEARRPLLEKVYTAIRAGKAYLDTALRRHDVIGYNDDTGWASCVPTGAARNSWNTRSFMVCADDILIEQ